MVTSKTFFLVFPSLALISFIFGYLGLQDGVIFNISASFIENPEIFFLLLICIILTRIKKRKH